MTKRAKSDIDSIRREIVEGGAKEAYDALLDICRDKQAPAQARSAAGVAIFRAAGMFEKKTEDNVDISEMTAEQLQKLASFYGDEIEKAEAKMARRAAGQPEDLGVADDGDDVFQ